MHEMSKSILYEDWKERMKVIWKCTKKFMFLENVSQTKHFETVKRKGHLLGAFWFWAWVIDGLGIESSSTLMLINPANQQLLRQ
jgi:hypothetical protein